MIFEKLSYDFNPGSFYVIKGESGCGKTTLLKCLSSLQELDSGQVQYSIDLPINQLRRKIQLLPQVPVIFEGSVKDNLLKPFSFKPYLEMMPSDEELEQKMSELFSDKVDLNKNALKLSQGEKQRLALCRTLMVEPEVLLCDEPTASLDKKSRKVVEDKIAGFASGNSKTVVFISHHDELLIDRKVTVLNLSSGSLEEMS